jgi:hypothetical protein
LKKSSIFFATLTTLAILLGLLFNGCSKPAPVIVHPAFYYWKTILQLDKDDIGRFKFLGIQRLYVRFFDLTWDSDAGQPVISNAVIISKVSPNQIQIIPVVYIAGDMMKVVKKNDLGSLAIHILLAVHKIYGKMSVTALPELQIDCDWVPDDKIKYFRLLEEIEKRKNLISSGLVISATIRLHQIKYSDKTGVPPVEKGVLMVYHTDSPFVLQNKSTILNLDSAKNYLKTIGSYPLSLDVALPIFNWVVQYNSHGKFIRILEDSDIALEKNNQLKSNGKNIYEAVEDTFLGDQRVMRGDFLKKDEVEPEDLLKTISFLRDRLKNREMNLILFHYNGEAIEKGFYGNWADIQRIYAF